MEKRVFWVILVSVVILVAYQHFIASRFQPPQAPVPVEVDKTTPPAPPAAVEEEQVPPPAAIVADLAPQLTEELKAQQDFYLQELEVNTELYRVVVTNKGGRIKSWTLHKHLDNNGNPLELVSPGSQATDHYPLSLLLDDAPLAKRLNTSLYKAERVGYSPEQKQEGLVFSYLDPSGLKVTKQLTFQHDNYYVEVNVQWENLNAEILFGLGLCPWSAV